jgi:aminoglycoside phosphotransferase (APT) family kinase protein
MDRDPMDRDPMDRDPMDAVRRALRVHAPELAGAPARELGRGLDHAAFVVGDLVVRVGDGAPAAREAALLAVVAPRVSLPVPAVRFAGDGVLAYRLLGGRPLLGRAAPAGLARPLGRFLRELHAIPDAPAAVEDADPGEWLDGLDGPEEMLRVLRDSVPAPAVRRVLTHADLGAEHILEEGGAITGIIDWGDAVVGDPALDFARLYRDFGPAFLGDVLAEYGKGNGDQGDVGLGRIAFFARCAALEDLAYGRETGRTEYVRSAQRSLGWLFAPPPSFPA